MIHRVWLAWAIECIMGNGTPRGLVGIGRGGWFRLGRLHVNGYFVCVGLRGKI